jgi:hypothetical protein
VNSATLEMEIGCTVGEYDAAVLVVAGDVVVFPAASAEATR